MSFHTFTQQTVTEFVLSFIFIYSTFLFNFYLFFFTSVLYLEQCALTLNKYIHVKKKKKNYKIGPRFTQSVSAELQIFF